MSVIAAVTKNGVSAIAADSQSNLGSSTIQPADLISNKTKIVQIADSYVGLTGSSTHGLVLKSLYSQHPDLFDFTSVDGVFETFRTLHPLLTEHYYLNTFEEEGQPYESNQMFGLICNQHGLFEFQSYREIAKLTKFWAVGSGDEYAIGALHAIYDHLDSAREIAEYGAKVACRYDNSCGEPVHSFEVAMA